MPEPPTEVTDHTDFLLSLVGIGVRDERLAHVEALIQARRLHAEIELDPTQAITHEELVQTLGAVE